MKRIILSSFLILAFVAITFAQNSEGLKVGDKVPDFKATADDGSTWNVKDYIGKKLLVIYFYPGAMTGGCTKQACAYRDHQAEINSTDAIVVGISGDNVQSLKLFKKADDLNFTLLSDTKGEIAAKFGVPIRSGGKITREVDGVSYDLVRDIATSRWTFIVDKKGTVIYKNEQVDATKDAEIVLGFIKNNS